MKKLFLSIIVSFVCICSSAEDKVSDYTMSFFDGKTYDIEATEVKNGKFTYYIFCETKDGHKQVGFSLKSSQIPDFVEQLRSIEGKFEEWSKTAEENNVTDFDKKFETNFKSVGTFWLYGSKWCFSTVKFKPYFKVTDTGETLAIISVGKMTSSTNQFMTSKGFYIVFSSVEEIEDFIKAIDPLHAVNRTQEQNDKEDLFN